MIKIATGHYRLVLRAVYHHKHKVWRIPNVPVFANSTMPVSWSLGVLLI